MIEMDARCVLFNLLQTMPEIDLELLSPFSAEVHKGYKEEYVYIDISYNGILSTIEEYGHYMQKKEDTISRTEVFGRFMDKDFLSKTINNKFPKALQESIQNACNTIKEQQEQKI